VRKKGRTNFHASCLHSVYTSIVVLAFLVTTLLFLIYERLVTRREKTKNAALKVVSSMFPSNVQEKVLRGAQDGIQLNSDEQNLIASFYPATTILFGMYTLFSDGRETVRSTRRPDFSSFCFLID
jgi:hypothetical protein